MLIKWFNLALTVTALVELLEQVSQEQQRELVVERGQPLKINHCSIVLDSYFYLDGELQHYCLTILHLTMISKDFSSTLLGLLFSIIPVWQILPTCAFLLLLRVQLLFEILASLEIQSQSVFLFKIFTKEHYTIILPSRLLRWSWSASSKLDGADVKSGMSPLSIPTLTLDQ